MDEDGNTDGKLYEYTGDHSSFADGIDPEELEEVMPIPVMEQGEKDEKLIDQGRKVFRS